MEASAKTPSSTLTPISTATFWATTATPAVLCSHSAAAFALNLNNEYEEEQAPMDYTEAHATKEPLFEKPLTPSDVGKLNRLVIPKQHAEKYFPMNGGGGDSGEKGLLLGFEDEMGQPWRFRYSYWNSSQSYVLTKGWSRYVKEKRLDAGDIVLFARHPKEVGRFFIGWRRMSGGGGGKDGCVSQPPRSGGWSGYSGYSYQNHHQLSTTSALPHTECSHAENRTRGIVRTGNSKRLRLFGVNLECDEDESEPVTPKDSTNVSSQTLVHEDPYHGYYSSRHTISYMLDSTNT